ncbi:MAG TPA: TRAP transporter large permease subunit [Synergistaceae bacterium]|nr:TRAP transporter large permease subunit [Synergistaceae bacterium]HPJ25888.1 TRAP transporter large permease subunit [Synergistaceae bacterium]HPQ38140.1 TRAP transporter large permease subunit [Synergistaceae bacterium]
MDLMTVSFTLIGLLVLCLGSSLWIGVALALVALGSFTLFLDLPALTILSNVLWNNTSGSTMMALPLFIFMGEILFRSKISENLFKGLSPWMDRIPGRLIHVNIFASTLFAAVSGSSAATTATVGKITLPEYKRRNYNMKLCIGSLAGAGTLGFLIPPSMMMLVYGIMADVSIGKLFIAGFIPGIIIAITFSGYVILRCAQHPEYAPRGDLSYTWKDRIRAIPLLAPVVILVGIVLGSIYAGWATPTEAAAVGVLGALFFAALTRSLSFDVFREALMGAVKTSCMIMWIVCGAAFLSVAVGYLGIPRALTAWISTLGLSPYVLMLILSGMYLFMGCLLDGFSMIVMSLPIALPLVRLAGFDPLWFGIFLIIMIQLAQITPPVGFNLFVINGLTEQSIGSIARAAVPFFLLLLVITILLTVFPNLVLMLPNMMVS